MIYLLSVLLLGITNSFAKAPEAKFLEFQKKINSNMESYCAKGVVAACNAKKEMENPGSSKAPPLNSQSLTGEDKAEIAEMSNKMKVCGEDMTCLQKLTDEQAKKSVDSKEAKCKSGSQEDCFWIEHIKLSNELQKSF
jgi:hypothetical protein